MTAEGHFYWNLLQGRASFSKSAAYLSKLVPGD